MPVHIALLRGINLAGYQQIKMADLRALAADLGLLEVKSLLQSGNLVFQNASSKHGHQLEALLESEAAARLNLHTNFFVRTDEEWKNVILQNPFHEQAKRDPSHVVVMFLKNRHIASYTQALQDTTKDPEIVRPVGRELYIVYPTGIGNSRLTNAVIEKKLVTRCTGRNWNTVLKLADLAGIRSTLSS